MKKFVIFLNLLLICPFVSISCVNEKGGYENGHEYVDLGLSVKWATCNIGADSTWYGGAHFEWGEVEPRQWGDSKENKYCEYGSDITKYCTIAKYGYNGLVDDKIILDAEDDAATINWGGRWRMPTKEEFDELCDNCTFELQTLNGKIGYKVIGKNGNFIFLPFAGYMDDERYQDGFIGYYWSSSCGYSDDEGAFHIYITAINKGIDSDYYLYGRCYGHSVRAVCP